MEDQSKINSLDRFRKRSPRLVLEQYSHCEVPAGCGGIVFRWRDPTQSVPLELWVYARGNVKAYLDGVECASSRGDLSVGRHVLDLHLVGIDRARAVLMVVGQEAFRDRVLFRSQADGSWLARTSEPAGLDDSTGWTVMIAGTLHRPSDQSTGYYTWHRCDEQKAVGLALPGGNGTGPLWVRKVFTLEASSP